MMEKLKHQMMEYLPLVLALTGSRVIPHPANFTPLSAAALWGGAVLNPRHAGIIVVTTMIVSDIILGFDNWPSRLTVYTSLLFTVWLGKRLLKKWGIGQVVLASATASLSFFILTNFSLWWWSDMYQHTPAGLMNCFTMALPFLRNSATADLIYSGIFAAGWELAKNFRGYGFLPRKIQ